ncbi:Chromosome-associated kinesin kif4a [Coemansia sp. RSA 1853]|nr:Chromosome-associated kinesin kif4a [Coemansia sp. RSA 1853]
MFSIRARAATMPTHTTDISATTSANSPVRVAVRIRPIEADIPGAPRSRAERTTCIEATGNDIILLPTHVDDDCGQRGRIVGGTRTEFHHAFGSAVSQQEVFDTAVAPLLAEFACGRNVAVMAYGQTGSGKTHSLGMAASPASGSDESSGVVPRALEWVFTQAPAKVIVGLVELYNRKVNALISGERPVASAADALALLQTGLRCRQTATTNANAVSSRSHAVFTVTVLWPGQRKASKLHFADLAGSERLADTQAEGKRLAEAKAINKSLLTLGRVVAALASPDSRFVPYRDDPLTSHLRDVLGGDARTLLLACVAGNEASRAETASTLGFGKRALFIKCRKNNGMPAGALGSAAEDAQKRLAAEAEAEKLRQMVKQLQLQTPAATQTVDAGTCTGDENTVDTGTDARGEKTIDTGTDAGNEQTVDAGTYTGCNQTVDTGTDTECKQSVDTGTDTECKQVINAGTSFCGYTKPRKLVRKVCAPVSAQSPGAHIDKSVGCIKPHVFVRKVRAPASAQSAGTDTGKTGVCIKPRKLVKKVRAPAKPKSKVSLRARVCSALHI